MLGSCRTLRTVRGQEVKAEVTRSKKTMHLKNEGDRLRVGGGSEVGIVDRRRCSYSAAQVTTWCEEKMRTLEFTSDV